MQSGLHELTHLWVRHTFNDLPSWLNEGLAGYFEETILTAEGLRTGGVDRGRTRLLLREQWLPAGVVFSVSHPSEFQKEREVHLFCAQSWAMVHLLRLSPHYGSRFDEFLDLLRADAPAEQALSKAFGLAPEELMQAAQKWVRQRASPAEILS